MLARTLVAIYYANITMNKKKNMQTFIEINNDSCSLSVGVGGSWDWGSALIMTYVKIATFHNTSGTNKIKSLRFLNQRHTIIQYKNIYKVQFLNLINNICQYNYILQQFLRTNQSITNYKLQINTPLTKYGEMVHPSRPYDTQT